MINKNKLAILGNLIFAVLIVTSAVMYMVLDCSPYIFKPIASSLFVLCGVFNIFVAYCIFGIKRNIPFTVAMITGLVLACLGDILLIDYFVIGAALFALGHVCFFVSFVCLTGFKIRDLLIGLAIFVAVLCIVLFVPIFDFGNMLVLVIAYAFVISFMLGKAVSNVFLVENRSVHLLIMLGAVLFFASDFMLMLYLFAGKAIVFDILCLSTYYPAEFLLAFSILFVAQNFAGRGLEMRDIKNMGMVDELETQPTKTESDSKE